MKLKEITPKEYQCTSMACPAVFEITPEAYQCSAVACPGVFEEKKKLVIIGRKVNNLKKLGLAKRVGKDEQAVIVDKGMLQQIFKK